MNSAGDMFGVMEMAWANDSGHFQAKPFPV